MPNSGSLLKSSRLTTEAWYKSKCTTIVYANYVKAGKAWLEKWVVKEPSNGDSDVGGPPEPVASGNGHAVFASAFNEAGEHTPTVLHMYVAFKCEHQKLGFSTAEGIRSAFKSYFEM